MEREIHAIHAIVVRRPLGWLLRLGALLWCLVLASHALAATDMVRIGIQLEPSSLDITTTSAATASEITYVMYMRVDLYREAGQFAPLATWKVSLDGTVDFALRRQVTYHDGKPFNAHTAVFSLRRMLALGSANTYLEWFDKIQSVEAVGNHMLRIHLSEPDSLLPYALALPAAVMVHPDSASGNVAKPVGTGPYRVSAWERGRWVRLLRNEEWWSTATPKIREAKFFFCQSLRPKHAGRRRYCARQQRDPVGWGVLRRARLCDEPLRPGGQAALALNNARAPLNDIRVRALTMPSPAASSATSTGRRSARCP